MGIKANDLISTFKSLNSFREGYGPSVEKAITALDSVVKNSKDRPYLTLAQLITELLVADSNGHNSRVNQLSRQIKSRLNTI